MQVVKGIVELDSMKEVGRRMVVVAQLSSDLLLLSILSPPILIRKSSINCNNLLTVLVSWLNHKQRKLSPNTFTMRTSVYKC